MEEFGPILHYIKGEDNIVADNLSRLGRLQDTICKAEENYGGSYQNQAVHGIFPAAR